MRTPIGIVCLWFTCCASHSGAPARPPLPAEPRMVVYREPPPGRVELRPPRPRDDAVWIDGVWNWVDRRWVWTKGGWVIAPREAKYFNWVVVRGADSKLYFSPAAWRDARGNIVASPTPLSTAIISAVPVVNPDGTQARTIIQQD